MSNGWLRVAGGIEKVLSEMARQSARQTGRVATGVVSHTHSAVSTALNHLSATEEVSRAMETLKQTSGANTVDKGQPISSAVESSEKKFPEMLIHADKERIRTTEEPEKPYKENYLDEKTSDHLSNSWAPPTPADGSSTNSKLSEGAAVPSTRFGRAWGFAQLGMNLALGSARQGVSNLLQSSADGQSSVVNDRNADTLAESLCRMRGAALKLGQMLSIQDQTLLPPPLTRALSQVRQGAQSMPLYQLKAQLEGQLGEDWRQSFTEFQEQPFAAASIGQCHRAVLQPENGAPERNAVVKVQYPGVAQSIESDLRNLGMLVKVSGLAPKGLFLDNVLRVGSAELKVECDYNREASNQERFRTLVAEDPVLQDNNFYVPEVFRSTDQVLVTEYCPGGTVDTVSDLSQEERNRIGRSILYLTIQELFVWRFMQTDPNWGNFLYDHGEGRTSLIDFGACREYDKAFVDGYLRIVWASANRDETTLLDHSHNMKFLTGDENNQMIHAHIQSGFTVGEPFQKDEPFDFRGSQISARMGEHTSVFLKHRLTAPPTEVYTLHRKLAGAYMLCIKLGSVVQARDLLREVVENHNFEDGLPPPIS